MLDKQSQSFEIQPARESNANSIDKPLDSQVLCMGEGAKHQAQGIRRMAQGKTAFSFCALIQKLNVFDMGKFQELKVWQRAKDLAVFIYRETSRGTFSKDFALREQIRRAVISISSNIAEGDELGSDRQSARFFYIARGSSAEVLSQSIIAFEIGYVKNDAFDHIERECRTISGMLTRLIQARGKND